MALSIDDAARLALALPEVSEGIRHGNRTWLVAGKVFLWERPFSKADIRRFADSPVPGGDIAAVTVADLGEKEAVLASRPEGVFTIEHFKNYPAVLLHLEKISKSALTELITDAWLLCAPPKLAEEFAGGA